MEPESASQSLVVQKHGSQVSVDTAEAKPVDIEQKQAWVVAQARTIVPFGTEVPLKVSQEYDVVEKGWNWISGEVGEEDEEGEVHGHQVRAGLTDVTNLSVVAVVGTQPGGSIIEAGQPVAVRREPTVEEKRSWELLQEAIKEGEMGLKDHQERRAGVVQHQKLQQSFPVPAVPTGPRGRKLQ